ncbi:MAG: hypothetical protein AAFX87_12200 [Bacteroidota bacterium]
MERQSFTHSESLEEDSEHSQKETIALVGVVSDKLGQSVKQSLETTPTMARDMAKSINR